MDIQVEHIGGLTRVHLSGALTSQSAHEVYDDLIKLALAAKGDMVVHAEGLETLTRAGASVITVTAKLLADRGESLVFRGAGPDIRSALSGSGLDHLIRFRPGNQDRELRVTSDPNPAVPARPSIAA